MRKDIPEDRADAFHAAASAGRALWTAGDVAGAEAKFMEAWRLIPEPKSAWDMSQSGVRAFEPQYRQWGKRPFAGLDKRYLAFVKERAAK